MIRFFRKTVPDAIRNLSNFQNCNERECQFSQLIGYTKNILGQQLTGAEWTHSFFICLHTTGRTENFWVKQKRTVKKGKVFLTFT